MDNWTNNTWANWLKDNKVPEETVALVKLKWVGHFDIPVKIIDVSKDGLTKFGMKRPPNDSGYYQFMWYSRIEKKYLITKYAIGVSGTKFKGKDFK